MIPRDGGLNPLPARFLRAIRLLLHLFRGVLTVAVLFPSYDRSRRRQAVGRWSARSLSILGVEVRVRGVPPESGGRPRLVVSNHVSWLDIQAIHAVWQVRFVAKSEVRRWPVIGWLSARSGTLFIERGSGRHAARINQSIHGAFVDGDDVGVFPEGTTTEGDRVERFHASLLQPAVDEQALVCPVALQYLDAQGHRCVAASYVGDDSLLHSIVSILRQRRIVAELHFLAPVETRGRSRRELAALARQAIVERLGLPA
jgi:1-acyl-sn-glycerol-3-phosphate acyltransferase